jgi:prevent-host-death family protein
VTTVVNITEAKTHLSRLLEAVERGEQVVIARAGRPVAILSAYAPPSRRKISPPGSLKGTDWVIPDDFDEPIDDLFEALSIDDEPLDRPEPR